MDSMGGLTEELERLRRENEARAALLQAAVGRVVERIGRDRGPADFLRELLVRLEPYVDVSRLPADLLEDLRRAVGSAEAEDPGEQDDGAGSRETARRDPGETGER
jgi:hypothetical protein